MKPVLYIISRIDLPSLNPGKMAAQVSHAASSCAYFYGKEKLYKEWSSETEQGFGTCIVLEANFETLKKVILDCRHKGLLTGYVDDPTYPFKASNEILKCVKHNFQVLKVEDDIAYCTREETTCAFILCDIEAPIPDSLVELPLHY